MLSGSFTLALKKFFNFVCQWTEGHNHWHTTTLTEKELTHKDILQFLVAFSRYRPEVDILPGRTWKCSMRSAFYWFAEFCHSQSLSHFAASFIVTRAEGSIAKSCNRILQSKLLNNNSRVAYAIFIYWCPAQLLTSIAKHLRVNPSTVTHSSWTHSKFLCFFKLDIIYRVNDPSAGSPTETLLRLLLPLSDKVH